MKSTAVCALSVTVGASRTRYPYQPVPLNQVVIREGLATALETNRWSGLAFAERNRRISNCAR